MRGETEARNPPPPPVSLQPCWGQGQGDPQEASCQPGLSLKGPRGSEPSFLRLSQATKHRALTKDLMGPAHHTPRHACLGHHSALPRPAAV